MIKSSDGQRCLNKSDHSTLRTKFSACFAPVFVSEGNLRHGRFERVACGNVGGQEITSQLDRNVRETGILFSRRYCQCFDSRKINKSPNMDPTRATREAFSYRLINIPLPEEAAESWRDLFSKLQKLFEKLTYHDAMRPNLQQTYMTPAASKNKVYFMWDFIGRTLVCSFLP